MLSKKQESIILKVYEFFNKNRKVTDREKRKALADEFISSLLSELEYNVSLLQKWTMLHPDYYKKKTDKRHNILEIMSDYVMNVDQVAERNAEHPVQNAEKDKRDQESRREREVTMEMKEPKFEEDYDSRVVYEHMTTSDQVDNPLDILVLKEDEEERTKQREEANSKLLELLLFEHKGTASTLEEFLDLIRLSKENVNHLVKLYADNEQPWNKKEAVKKEEEKDYKKRTPTLVRNEILRLDESRVKECEVCGEAYYAHHNRNDRKYCDLIQYDRRFSLCQHRANNLKTLELYYSRKKKSTV